MASFNDRPAAAGTVAALLIVFGALGIVLTLVLSLSAQDAIGDPGVFLPLILQVLLSTGQIISGVHLRNGRGWARDLAILLCAVNLITGFVTLFIGSALGGLLSLALNTALLAMLSRRDVREWCADKPKSANVAGDDGGW